MRFNVVVFGSAFYDTYILSDEFVLKQTSDGEMLCTPYGKKVELKDAVVTTGGGATNAAVCLERMGLQTGLVTCLGKDFWGRMVREQLEQEGVSPLYIQINKLQKTSSSIALVGKDGDRTILVHRGASNYLSWKLVGHKLYGTVSAYANSREVLAGFLKNGYELISDVSKILEDEGEFELDYGKGILSQYNASRVLIIK